MKFTIYKASDGFNGYPKPCEKASIKPPGNGFYRFAKFIIGIPFPGKFWNWLVVNSTWKE